MDSRCGSASLGRSRYLELNSKTSSTRTILPRPPGCCGVISNIRRLSSLDNLRAPVEFRGDGYYDLGDLLPHVLKEWRKRLEDGEKSAAHWKRDDEKKALAAKRAKAKQLIAKVNTEQWAINPSVHFNEWLTCNATSSRKSWTRSRSCLRTYVARTQTASLTFTFCRAKESRRDAL
jgi:hypothetical protein